MPYLDPIADFLLQTALAGVILVCALLAALKLVAPLLVRLHPLRQRSEIDDRSEPETESEDPALVELQNENRLVRAENGLLREIIGLTDPAAAVELYLRRFVPKRRTGFAAYFKQTPQGYRLWRGRGLSKASRKQIQIDEALARQVERNRFVVLERVRLYESLLMASLAPRDRKNVQRLYLLSVADRERTHGMFVTTSLFPAEVPPECREPVARRLIAILSRHLKRFQTHEAQRTLLRTTSEMLELRKIADRKAASPVLMIEAFLERLADQIGVERSAFFVSTGDGVLLKTALVRTGKPVQQNLLGRWQMHEELLAEIGLISARPVGMNREELQELGIETLISRAMVVPMTLGRDTSGVLCFCDGHSEPFDENDLELVSWAAEFLAETIHRVVQQAITEQQARQDGLTGLANRRVFDEAIQSAVDAVRRWGSRFALLLIDLDRFKLVNDTWGHPTGDAVLKQVAGLIRDRLEERTGSGRALAARYGGEEIAVLLHETDVDGALAFGEEIRAAAEETRFAGEGDCPAVTLCVGVAGFPQHADSAEGLIAAADTALIEAKRRGRNRALCYDGTLI